MSLVPMTRVWQRLYVGSIRDAEKLAGDNNPAGITSVISLCPEAVARRAGGVSYVRIPISDSDPIPVRKFEAVIAVLAASIRNGKILLHCGAGMSRAPIFAAAWMHRVGHLHIESALLEIAELRPVIDPSPVLLKSVKEHLCR
jgi:protein-tyrosine phosphatase